MVTSDCTLKSYSSKILKKIVISTGTQWHGEIYMWCQMFPSDTAYSSFERMPYLNKQSAGNSRLHSN